MARPLLLLFFGGNAREALLAVFAANKFRPEWQVLGFVDDDSSKHGQDCCGIRVLGGREVLEQHPHAFVLALPGNPENSHRRKKVIDGLNLDESRFAHIVHPAATVSPDAIIGFNTVVMANVVISCGVRIGNHCILLPNTVVSHDSRIGDFCCLGSNISISGGVKIGNGCYVGSGTKMKENISVGDGAMLGLGSNVISDIPEGVVAVGSPARPIRQRISEDI